MGRTGDTARNATSKRVVFKWELWGIPAIFLSGAAVHFVYEWSGNSPIVALFAPVNESVWEHFRLAFWPMCIFAAIEYPSLRDKVNNFISAKAAALFIVPIVEGTVFYAYTPIIGREILAVDIVGFLVGVTLAQFLSYRILMAAALPRYINVIAACFAAFLAVIFAVFSFFPPYLPIFLDGRGFYGVP